MLERTVSALILFVAIIHLLPITGFFGAERISVLYQIEIADRNLQILMRHRAAMFGMLGAFLACAAFTPSQQPAAIAMALFSVVTFLYLCVEVGSYSDAIARIFIADVLALACLLVAAALYWFRRSL